MMKIKKLGRVLDRKYRIVGRHLLKKWREYLFIFLFIFGWACVIFSLSMLTTWLVAPLIVGVLSLGFLGIDLQWQLLKKGFYYLSQEDSSNS